MNIKDLTTKQRSYAKGLLECLSIGQYKITYSELAEKYGNGVTDRNIGRDLGNVSMHCVELGLPPISVIVVNKETQTCGEGFFNLCRELDLYPQFANSMKSTIEAAGEDVKKCTEWWKLAEHIGVNINGMEKPID